MQKQLLSVIVTDSLILPFRCRRQQKLNCNYYMILTRDIRTISILGCGWYGFPLAQAFLSEGYKVNGSTTSEQKFPVLEEAGIKPFLVRFEADAAKFATEFFECDLLIISIPPKRAAGETESFPKKIEAIKTAATTAGVKHIIFISSTGGYGGPNMEVDEGTPPQPDSDSGKVLLQAENRLKDSSAFKVTVLRFGGLIGPGRNPARFFAGKKTISNGRAPVNLIHLDDCISVTRAVIAKQALGLTINACSPEHPSRMEFYTRAAINSGLEPPEFVDELKSWKVVNSKVLPRLNCTFSGLNS